MEAVIFFEKSVISCRPLISEYYLGNKMGRFEKLKMSKEIWYV
jgi:hypothetical protein